jgi:hypothetical protein
MQDFERQPTGFNGVAWRAKHNALVRKTAAWQQQGGGTVFLESQNRFTLRGRSGVVLTGQPDLISIQASRGRVTDCKTGSPQDCHVAQVKTYMLALPYARLEYTNVELSGRVQYDGDAYDIRPEDIDEEFRQQFRDTMALLAGDQPPSSVPSEWECKYCPLTSQDCPARVEPDSQSGDGSSTTELF